MAQAISQEITSPRVLREAADILAATVARTTAVAVLSADVCGCPGCRAAAAATVAWALSMAQPRGETNTSPTGTRTLERWLDADRARSRTQP